MVSPHVKLPPHHLLVLDRFIAACQTDRRVIAAFLGGSYARGTADAYSDLDLYLISVDEAFEDVLAGREAFLAELGELLFLEDFNLPDIAFFIFADGVEGELAFGRQSRFDHLHHGPYMVLVDKKRILEGWVFRPVAPAPAEQLETLRSTLCTFWHELSHCITALGRGQLWWAYGQLESLRAHCVVLARLEYDFIASPDASEPYFKVEQALATARLNPLQATCCPREPAAMLQAVFTILQFFRELAPPLARKYGLNYPAGLDRVMSDRLDKLRFGA